MAGRLTQCASEVGPPMRAAVLCGPGRLELRDVPEPEPAPGEALVHVRACGVCGSDLRYLRGENPWARHTLGVDRPNPPEMILGHEVAGEVDWGPPRGRERVAVLAFKTCGVCRLCRQGKEHLCADTEHLGHGAGWRDRPYNPGGMAERMPAWVDHLYPLPDRISFEEATLLDGLGVAVHAVGRAGVRWGDRVAIWGCGPIGLLIAQTARALGAASIVALDRNEAALETARELGATLVRDVGHVPPAEVVPEVVAATGGDGPDAVVDTTGALEVQSAALAMVGRGGTVLLMAGAAEGLEVPRSFHAAERTLTTSCNNTLREYQIGLELLTQGRVRVAPLISHRFALTQVTEAFAAAADKERSGALKVVVLP